jgi:fermentation-respiration switch protein FrsA (DUF1100 family)
MAVVVAGGYAIMAMVGAGCANRLLFPRPPSSYADSSDLIRLSTSNGDTIVAVHLTSPGARRTVIYSHGNGEDLGLARFMYERIHQAGFNVFAYEYPGYGLSDGRATEASTCAAIDAAYDYLTRDQGLTPDSIVLYGRSVGSGPSVDLAARKPVAGLVLEGAFVSAFRIVTRVPLLWWDKFENLKKIPHVNCPILIMHGRRDMIVGFWHGNKLAQAVTDQVQTFWVDEAGHNDLVIVAGERYIDALEKFSALIDQARHTPADITVTSP